MIKSYFSNEIKNVLNQKIKINIIGEIKNFQRPEDCSKKTAYLTKNNKKIIVNLAINYGSKMKY